MLRLTVGKKMHLPVSQKYYLFDFKIPTTKYLIVTDT